MNIWEIAEKIAQYQEAIAQYQQAIAQYQNTIKELMSLSVPNSEGDLIPYQDCVYEEWEHF